MDHADNNDVFVYMGGNQEVPRGVTHVRIHESVKIIAASAFQHCIHLVSIAMHDGVEIIGTAAFNNCPSLIEIKLPGVRVIEEHAFYYCTALEDVEFGDKLETIGVNSFNRCTALRSIKLPKVRVIGGYAFWDCRQLTDVELSEDLETIGGRGIGGAAFGSCPRVRRITLPLKDNLLENNVVFYGCRDLSTVNLVGGIHKTVSSLLLDNWRNEMNDEIDRINFDLPNTATNRKTRVIQQWMVTVIRRVEHFKSEHYALLKKNMTQLELALWNSNLQQQEERLWLKWVDKQPAKKVKIDIDAVRHEARITCGANLIIPQVLSFLNDEDVFPTLNHNS